MGFRDLQEHVRKLRVGLQEFKYTCVSEEEKRIPQGTDSFDDALCRVSGLHRPCKDQRGASVLNVNPTTVSPLIRETGHNSSDFIPTLRRSKRQDCLILL
eukprot:TRINITY_DN8086_c0_g1_i1.p1 TRINITY_DN8086_c0_g1~~TRINITY_DN8086_c0_g1_i1.p1  ORF type:complete len:100 (-),score=6.16 TRINITY_DN8086_c0_g1_i1:51-350(-)